MDTGNLIEKTLSGLVDSFGAGLFSFPFPLPLFSFLTVFF